MTSEQAEAFIGSISEAARIYEEARNSTKTGAVDLAEEQQTAVMQQKLGMKIFGELQFVQYQVHDDVLQQCHHQQPHAKFGWSP